MINSGITITFKSKLLRPICVKNMAVKLPLFIFIFLPFLLHINCQDKETENNDGLLSADPNRTQLECVYSSTSAEHICDCKNRKRPYVLQMLTGNINSLIVRNCKDLSVNAGTFTNVAFIRKIQFRNIDNLILSSYSLDSNRRLPAPEIKLSFQNVKFQQLNSYAISGYIDSVDFSECHINTFNAYAINLLYQSVFNISFVNTVIGTIERQALKKLHIDYLMFRNTTFLSYLPSQTFSALMITNEFAIINSSFTTIKTHAFDLDDVNGFIFVDNQIGDLNAEAFKINVNGQIIIERNNFARISHLALKGILNGERMQQSTKDIQFSSNTIHSTDTPIRFEIDRKLHLRIHDLKFADFIDCVEADTLKQNPFLLPYADSVYFRFGKITDINLEYRSLSNILMNECTVTTYIVAIVSTIVVFALILIIAIVAVFYRFWLKRQPPPRQMNMVIPDGKTYRETQIVVQIENAGLLKTNL